MKPRDELSLLGAAVAILFAGALIGGAVVSVHHAQGTLATTPTIDDGAIDFAEELPVAP